MFNREIKTGKILEAAPNLSEIQRSIDEQRLRALAKGTLRVMNPSTGVTEIAENYYCVSDKPPRFYTREEAQNRVSTQS